MKFEKEAHYRPSMTKAVSANIVLLFCILIFGFFIATVLKRQDERSEAENRSLAQRPEFSWQALFSGQFAKDYEDYLSDQFIGRDKWITLKTDFERSTGKQDINGVYFAKDGYMIESHAGTFTSKQAQANIGLLSTWAARMVTDSGTVKADEGTVPADGDTGQAAGQAYDPQHFTVMIIPNAVDILRDKLPAYADPYDEEEYLQKIKDALPESVWFDASAVLSQHKDEDIFYHTDHHWKTLAAWYTYQEWAKEKGLTVGSYSPVTVTEDFEGTISSKLGIKGRPDSIERYDPEVQKDCYLVYNQSDDVRNSVYDDSFLQTKDKYSYFYGGNFGLIESKMPGSSTGRKLLIIKDSYAHCFAPFTYENFDEVDLLDLRYYNSPLSELMAEKGYTDILFLQNAAGFAEETSFAKLGA